MNFINEHVLGVYLIGCLFSLLFCIKISHRDWEEGRDVLLPELYYIILITASSWIMVFFIILTAISDMIKSWKLNEIVLIKGKNNG